MKPAPCFQRVTEPHTPAMGKMKSAITDGAMGIYGKKTESVWFRRRGTNVSLTTAPFHRCSRKTALDNMETNGQSCVPIKLYLQNWAGARPGVLAIVC